MQLDITPEPSREERAAIAAALGKLFVLGPTSLGPWWEAAVREAIEEDDA